MSAHRTYTLFRCPEHPHWATMDAGRYCPLYHGFEGRKPRDPRKERITVAEVDK